MRVTHFFTFLYGFAHLWKCVKFISVCKIQLKNVLNFFKIIGGELFC